MIVYDLCCDGGHRFEGWFGSSADYASQRERGLVACPQCGSGVVDKAPMAPAVPRKGNQQQAETKLPVASGGMAIEAAAMLRKLAEIQAEVLKSSTWVGDDFPERTREIHYGERETGAIHGQATAEEAKALLDEGITIAPLLFPVAPPEELN
jgi:hypothetical protein